MEDYSEVFISEAEEHLNTLNQQLLELEKDPTNGEVINEIFRAAHTLKGMSATMGYEGISKITHNIENLLDEARNGKIEVSSEIVDVLFEAMDIVEAALSQIAESGREEVDAEEVSQKLGRLKAGENSTSRGTTQEGEEREEKEEPGEGVKRVDVELEEECSLKSVRAFMVFKEVKEFGEIEKTFPGEEKLEDGDFELSFSIFIKTESDDDEIKSLINNISEVKNVEVHSGEKSKSTGAGKTKSSKSSAEVRSLQTVRVPIDRLDSLMNFVGELVISKSQLFQVMRKHGIDELNETLNYLDKLTASLQEEVQEMRMVEVRYVFDRFPRMVRDLARKEGKKVEFNVEGKHIELDRTVLEEIGDPIVHLLRNCIDHGIEEPERRVEKGKREEGRILLQAKRVKDRVEIVVEDDGRGIDPEKLKEIAQDRGIVSGKEAERMSEEEARSLIFAPGFSSAGEVSEVSGRGVGLDVVRDKVLSFGGNINVESELEKGTSFVLQLPITLAITEVLLVYAGGEIYAIPINNVSEILNLSGEDIDGVLGRKVVRIREKIVPLFDLLAFFGKGPGPNGESGEDHPVVIVEKEGMEIGIVVEELIGQQEIVIKSLEGSLRDVRGFAGATILGDGRVAMILDIGGLEV